MSEYRPRRQHINFIDQNDPTRPPRKKRSRKRVIFLFVLALLFLYGCGRVYSHFSDPAPQEPTAYDPVTLEPINKGGFFSRLKDFVFGKNDVLEGEKSDRINVLLLGMGGIGHDGPFLTDTIIIASIKPSTGEIAMISIPRDLGVKIPGHGWQKINHANAYGEAKKQNAGAAFATGVVSDMFDIDIHYYARVDFTAFKEIIDEVGGVTVNVERSFTDYEYPAANHEYQVVSFQKGVQTMDGETALQFARSRHGNNGEASDFARARRQQKVLLALKEKLLTFTTLSNPVHINNILNTLETHINTNLQFSDIIGLLKIGRDMESPDITTVVLDNAVDGYLQNGFSPNGAFILEPKTGNFKEINTLVANVFEQEPAKKDDTPIQTAPAPKPANIEIQNGTWQAGFAARTRNKLEKQGYTIHSIDNTQEKPHLESGIYHTGEKPLVDVLESLKAELDIPIKEALPIGEQVHIDTDILIILGEDIVQ